MRMRSLFVKIFFWFWLAIMLSGVVLFLLAVTTRSGPVAEHRHRLSEQRRKLTGQTLALYGQAAVEILERNGPAALDAFSARVESSESIRTFLFPVQEEPGSGREAPPAVRELAKRAGASGKTEIGSRGDPLLLAQPVFGPEGRRYVIVGEFPGRPGRPFGPIDRFTRDLGTRTFVTLLVSGLVCYGLAWHLTAPVRKLRKATQQLAGGDLTARVGLGDSGRRDEIAGLGRDFDGMAERIQGLLDHQQQLLRDISHELRSPLARLNVALELARKKSGPEAGAPLDRIERETERLNGLIGQLLAITKLESGAGRWEKEPVDLASLVQEVARDADYEAKNRRRAVTVVRSGPVTVSGSREMLRRAIENVVRNAAYYTAEESAVEITLDSRQERGERHAVITVRDHGRGVPESALPHLFRPFYRVADARDRETGGTGLGLAISERAVRLHGGRITAANAAGGGLKMEINLPARTEGRKSS
jgi:two-component system sensor histidine kinase CpxA